MAKKPNAGLDYTPRRAKAVAAAHQRPVERVTHGVVTHRQYHPIFMVLSAGKCIEWSSKREAAHAAFAQANALPKQLLMAHDDGRRVLLDEVSATGRLLNREMRLAA